MRVLCCPDKFRGTLTASAAAEALARGVRNGGAVPSTHPLSDGGEGFVAAVGPPNRSTRVTGPLGDEVDAAWALRRGVAWIETAATSGLTLVGGPEGNDAIAASTTGVGELIVAAIDAGAKRVIVGMGGSATTDGGWGAIQALHPLHRLLGIELIAACDVDIRFVDAATRFAAQKGASRAQVALLERRLRRLAEVYEDEFGVDISALDGSGAAGGLAGGLAALGFSLQPGFEVVAERTGWFEQLETADLVITGEGLFDAESLHGKVVGGVIDAAQAQGVPVAAIVGEADPSAPVPEAVTLISLTERFGDERSWSEPDTLLEMVASELVSGTKSFAAPP